MGTSRFVLGTAIFLPKVLGFLAPISIEPRDAAPFLCSARHDDRSSRHVSMQPAQPILEMTPRRKQFFRTVSEGLRVGFEGQDVSRIEKFVQYCRGELPYEPQGTLHQPSEEYIEGLRAKPWWEPEEFDWVRKLEEKSSIVVDEFAEFWNDPMSSFARDSNAMNIMGKGWSGVRLQRLGEWLPDNCAKFPKTVTLLKELEIPLAVRGVMFARQLPGTGVSPHSDGRNFILTTHLGVDVPEDCWMRVGEEKRVWENGKALVLDTSFEHETRNNSRRDRIVLIIDYWHPGHFDPPVMGDDSSKITHVSFSVYSSGHDTYLTAAERDALGFIYNLRNRFESGEIPLDEGEDKEEARGFFGSIRKAFGS